MGVVWRGYDTVLDRPIAVENDPTAGTVVRQRGRRDSRTVPPGSPVHRTNPAPRGAADLRRAAEGRSHSGLSCDGIGRGRYHAAGIREFGISAAREPRGVGRRPDCYRVVICLCRADRAPRLGAGQHPDHPGRHGEDHRLWDRGSADSGYATSGQSGRVVGTCRYMAPEQGAGARPNSCADLCALGCVMYEMLCG